MIGLLQRVSHASVTIDDSTIAEINKGLLVLIGMQQEDDQESANRLFQK